MQFRPLAFALPRVITALVGGTPAAVPERYAQSSSVKLVLLGIPQVLLIGQYEEFVPRSFAEAYVRAAARADDRANLIVVPNVGHFEIASPRVVTWPRVAAVIRSLPDGKLPLGITTPTRAATACGA